MNRLKRNVCFILILMMLIYSAMPCGAATKTAIKSVRIKVAAEIEAGQEVGTEDIAVTAGTAGYELDYWEIRNEAFVWESGMVPEIAIYLNAEDNYYFSITKASKINLSGCTYKSAQRLNSATTLEVIVTLPAIGNSIGEPEQTEITEKGLCKWSTVSEAGSYEVRFMRDSAILGGTKTVSADTTAEITVGGEKIPACSYDAMQYVTRGGSYYFKVRAVHKKDPTVKGKWTESQMMTLNDAEASAVAQEYNDIQSTGEWITDGAGTKFRLPDGRFLTGEWRRINNEWYYFKPDGYMAKDWSQVDGAWYYFDPSTGVMWKNTTTPDGYTLGIDGRRY